ncbi:MAG TPA: hypothetical protein VGD08_00280 [Stellaceae bacterium]
MLFAGLLATPAPAQDLQALRREMQDMKRQYDAQFQKLQRDYESRLQQMEQRLKAAENSASEAQKAAVEAAQHAPPTPAAIAEPAPPAAIAGPASSGYLASGGAPSAGGSGFNPAIGAVLDGRFGYFSQNPDSYKIPGVPLGPDAGPGLRGFALGETELNFSANIDPYLYGNATIAVERTGDVSVEEAFFQTTGLPYGFTVRGGRFFSGIGYMNEQHAHVWDFVDTALPYRAFLNTQYDDDGVQVRWLAPTPFFLEFGSEVFRGDAYPAGGGGRVAGAYSGFAHIGDDIGESASYRVGVSHLRAKAQDRLSDNGDAFRGRSNVTILDGVYKWAPGGNPVDTNLKLQGEYFFRNENGLFNSGNYTSGGQGWYLQAVYQFMPQWQIGLRHDEVRVNNDGEAVTPGSVLDTFGHGASRESVALTYYTSEFGRFRAQYNLDESRPKTDHQFLLQYTVSLGAHGAHAF